MFPTRVVERAHIYPSVNGETVKDVQSRVMSALFGEEIPDPRDSMIIGLAAASGVFESILSREELADVRERIDLISRLDLMSRTVQKSIRTIKPDAPAVKTVQPPEKITEVPGLPIAGNAFQMAGDIVHFLTRCYKKYGPIFRIRAFGYRFIALVGPEANIPLTKHSGTYFRSHEAYQDFSVAMGAHRSILNMDGPEHLRMRKLQAKGYSPKAFKTNLAQVEDITPNVIEKWPQGQPIQIQRAMQEIVAEQIGQCCTGISAEEFIDDIIHYLKLKISIYISKRWSPLIERLPKSRRLNQRMGELYERILEAHHPDKRVGVTPDFVDDLLEINRSDPQLLPETDLRANILAPFMVGIDTSGSICALMLFSLLKYPELLEQVREEVDEMYARGPLTPEGLRGLDVTHRVALESLRIYPVTPAVRRTAANSFEFAGYQVPSGAELMFGTTVSHQLPECFPDPERFDIERYTKSEKQHRKPGAFVPFGAGRHRCIAAALSELQIVTTLAIIVRETELELDRPERPLKINYSPNPHIDESLHFRLMRRRNN